MLLLVSCNHSSGGLNYEELEKLSATHSLNQNIKSEIGKIEKDSINYVGFKKPIFILIATKFGSEKEVCISKTDFKIFKMARAEQYEKVKGYTSFNKIPVLMFGDLDIISSKLEDNDVEDVLGGLPKYEKDNPPIVYEPRMVCHKYSAQLKQ